MNDKEKNENEENKDLEFSDEDLENMSGGASAPRKNQNHTVGPGVTPPNVDNK